MSVANNWEVVHIRDRCGIKKVAYSKDCLWGSIFQTWWVHFLGNEKWRYTRKIFPHYMGTRAAKAMKRPCIAWQAVFVPGTISLVLHSTECLWLQNRLISLMTGMVFDKNNPHQSGSFIYFDYMYCYWYLARYENTRKTSILNLEIFANLPSKILLRL